MDAVSALTSRLKALREAAGLSQNQLAEALGVSRGRISYYENGERTPDVEFLALVRNYFQVDYEYLLGECEFKTTEEKEDVSKKKSVIESLLDNESPEDKLQLMKIFETVHDMYNTLYSADMEVAKVFLSKIHALLSCIYSCCEDAEIISEGIYHKAYDNIDADSFDSYAWELLDLSAKMKEKANSIVGKLLDDIRHESTGKLADYYKIEIPEDDMQHYRRLDVISEKLRALEADDANNGSSQGGELDGNGD